ncbi:MAG: hypothetical protein EOO01_37525 [Chitinophagaceae bacterium]|nr:MAG: hypothetical protein EOO01_37525 [Chitinophagaceae bacterium]
MTGLKQPIFVPAFTALLSLYFILGIAACNRMSSEDTKKPATSIPADDTMRIDPGQRIGKIALGMPADKIGFLGNPDLSDAAMGKAWLTWFSKNSHSVSGKFELNIFTAALDPEVSEKEVRCIRVTSPDFKTTNGVATNVDSASVFKAYPNLKFIGTYTEKRGLPEISVYEDAKTGIGIELDGADKKCSAVIVFSTEAGLMPDYGYFRPDLQRS